MGNLKEKFQSELAPKLQEQMGVENKMLVPRLQKVVINIGFGIVEKDVQKGLIDDLAKLSGQRPILCKARKSISNFKLREGMIVGAKVTLRGKRMYDFVERLVNSALPRIRDFRGVPRRGFDTFGNYTLGLKEHTIFPELLDSTATYESGMDVTFVTSARDKKSAYQLLEVLGMPFAGK